MLQINRLKVCLDYIDQKRITTVAGAWVFYFLSALLPLTFLLITAYGVFGVDFSLELVAGLPEYLRDNATKLVNTAKNASNGVTVFFIISVVISGSALIRQMMKDGCFIYGVKARSSGVLRIIKGVFALAVLYLIFLVWAMLLLFGEIIFNRLFSNRSALTFAVFSALLFTLVSYAVIILLNKFVCPVGVKNSAICFASLISLTVVFVGTVALRVYFRFFSKMNVFYGSLAGVVGFLLWAYVCMLGLVLGVIVCAYLSGLKRFKPSVTNKITLKNYS